MEEIHTQSDYNKSPSSSASSPARSVPSSNFFYLRKPGSLGQPISIKDSPDWGDTDNELRIEEGRNSNPKVSSSKFLPEDGSCVARKIAGVSVVWKDLTISVKGKRKYSDKVIKCSTGYALPGTITVIMGPAKSGKSTILRAIAGRLLGSTKVYGDVLVNGAKKPMPYGSYGYVAKKISLIESLTVREFLYYSALLQIPGFFCREKSSCVVEDAISAMSLSDHANKLIGGHCNIKGLPNGERRRVCIARELVMRPHVLFIDEPLFHLNSVSALLMMVTLKKLANTGCTLIFTINQSSTEVFGLFDRICLLSNGNTLFFGETLSCLQHFSNAGFPCPIMQSPSDHFLRAIDTDFDRIISMCKNWQDDHGEFQPVNMDTAIAIHTLEATYKSSADATAVETMILKLTEREGPLLKNKGKAGIFTKTAVLTRRSLLVMSREWKYFWLRLILCMILTICVGTVFSGLGHSLPSVRKRVAAIFVFVSFTSLISIAGIPAHMKEIEIYNGEESNQHSGALVFLLGHSLSSFPFLFLISVSSTLVFYFLLGLRDGFCLLLYFTLNIFMCHLINEGLLLLVASICGDIFWSILILVTIHAIMMLSAGYFRIRNDLPRAVWLYPVSYIAFHTYSLKGLLENEYIESSFEALRSEFDVSSGSDSKWGDLRALLLMAVCYRLAVFFILHFRFRKGLWVCRFWVYNDKDKSTK